MKTSWKDILRENLKNPVVSTNKPKFIYVVKETTEEEIENFKNEINNLTNK